MIPERYARYYLEHAPSLLWLIGANLLAMFVGIRFYLDTMGEVNTFLWLAYLDSPMAVLLMALSLATLVPFVGQDARSATTNVAAAYLHTLAFVWLVKFGLWTVAALNVGFWSYFPALWAYWGIIATHLLFVLQAYLIPHYGRTTPGALAFALVAVLGNDLLDYGFGLHPPLRYEPGVALPVVSVGLSVLAVLLASRAFTRVDAGTSTRERRYA